jgi:hypothetical protein
VASNTVTVKRRVAVLPSESRAEQVTVVVPNLNVLSERGSQSGRNGRLRLSVAETVYVTVAPSLLVAAVLIGSGTTMSGGLLLDPWFGAGSGIGRTVTLNLLVVWLPAESWAEQITVVVPMPKRVPERGSQSGVTVRSRLSVAETR